jgi:RHS repeat-associated protein
LAAPVNGVYAPPVITQIDERDPTGVSLAGLNYANENKNNFGFINRETIAETGWIDLNNRFYMPDLMRFGQTDPIIEGQEHLSLYQYGWNNPVRFSDPNGDFPCIPCFVILGGFLLSSQPAMAPSGGANAKREQAAYKQAYNSMGQDVLSAGFPVAKTERVSAALYSMAKREVKEEIKEQGQKQVEKTYQTYTKTNGTTGEVYSGKTSGTGTPEANVRNRDSKPDHKAKTEKGYGPAVLEKSSSNSDAIRGREQHLIDKNGGAKSQGGTSGNAYNSISPTNKKAQQYKDAAIKEFRQKE